MSEDSLWSDYKNEYENLVPSEPIKKEIKKMNITILSVDVKTIPTAKGSYQTAEVAYKNNSFQGKVEGKKIMSFGATAASFKTLLSAQSGDTYEVNIVKNDKGYNDWVSMAPAGADTPAAAPQIATGAPAKSGGAIPTRSTYETPEERAAKQVYIIRQSSLNNALSMLAVASKNPLKLEDVLEVASKMETYVLKGSKVQDIATFSDFPDTDFPTPE